MQPQYKVMNASAIPPRDYSCKGECGGFFFSFGATLEQKINNSCKLTKAILARFSTSRKLHNFAQKTITASPPTLGCC